MRENYDLIGEVAINKRTLQGDSLSPQRSRSHVSMWAHAFHLLSELTSRTIARPVSLKMK